MDTDRHRHRQWSAVTQLSSVLRMNSCTWQGGVITCLLFSMSSTGCASQSGLTSASPFSFNIVSMVQCHVTSPVSFNGSPTPPHASVCAWHRHRHCMFHGRCTRPLATMHSLSLPRKSGTSCRRRSCHCRHCTCSSAHRRQNCSADLMVMHTTGRSNNDCYVTHTAALKFLLRLVSR